MDVRTGGLALMPLSRREAARQRQLDNLRTGPPAPKGNQLSRSHGGYATVAVERMEAKAREVYDALAADVPLKENGGLPAADSVAVRMLAEALCRLEDVSAHLRDFGLYDQETKAERPAVAREQQLRREVADWLDALAMTPRSRGKLSIDLVKSRDLALEMADAERREQEGGGGDG
ncbi:MAG TPA: P27 family phage terminase small subunit [Thermoleophilaceae bacterium]|nr:P27 family phage terminase small subunit [Thermoleophilaceae bacterium]